VVAVVLQTGLTLHWVELVVVAEVLITEGLLLLERLKKVLAVVVAGGQLCLVAMVAQALSFFVTLPSTQSQAVQV
jgi:hypothetical protein